jgi:hypothetical protein
VHSIRCVVVTVVGKDIPPLIRSKPYAADTICTMDTMALNLSSQYMSAQALNLSSQCMSAQYPKKVISADEKNFSTEHLSKRARCSLRFWGYSTQAVPPGDGERHKPVKRQLHQKKGLHHLRCKGILPPLWI